VETRRAAVAAGGGRVSHITSATIVLSSTQTPNPADVASYTLYGRHTRPAARHCRPAQRQLLIREIYLHLSPAEPALDRRAITCPRQPANLTRRDRRPPAWPLSKLMYRVARARHDDTINWQNEQLRIALRPYNRYTDPHSLAAILGQRSARPQSSARLPSGGMRAADLVQREQTAEWNEVSQAAVVPIFPPLAALSTGNDAELQMKPSTMRAAGGHRQQR